MYPARVAVTGDLHADERMVPMLVDAVITVTHNGSVDVPGPRIEDQLDHSAASRYKTLLEVLDQDLREMIEIRNKLAHGQWIYGLTDDGRVSSELTKRLRTTNTLALRFQDSIAEDLANAVGDLLLPGNQFDARFDEHYRKIRSSHESLANIDFPAHVERLKGSKKKIRVTKLTNGISTA